MSHDAKQINVNFVEFAQLLAGREVRSQLQSRYPTTNSIYIKNYNFFEYFMCLKILKTTIGNSAEVS